MKKLLLVLVVLALAMPAMAAVTLTESGKTGTTVTIGYTYDTAVPRAFALVLQATGGTITSVTPYMKGESGVVSTDNPSGLKGFGIFPGTIEIDATGAVTSLGTPVEPTDLPGGPSATGTARVVVALGSLYVADGNKPVSPGTLFTVVCSTGTTSLNISEEDTSRGGVVNENAGGETVSPLNVVFADPPPPAPATVTATQAAAATTITVTWTPSAGATGYDVYKGYKPDFSDRALVGTGNQVSPFVYTVANIGTGTLTQTNADGRTTYFFVKAKNSGGSSPFNTTAAQGWTTECIKGTAWLTSWRALGRPNCWAFQRNCRGDADGIGGGLGLNKVWVNAADLSILAAGWGKMQSEIVNIYYNNVPSICGDNDRAGGGLGLNKIWVNSGDLGRLATYFTQFQSVTPVCGTLAGETTWFTSNINWWKN